ncbi:Dam family site-specific DNA-(adenine-N6)-methyltransferase [Limnobaculum xujianqingii]|uniref:Dam family site-specific DNA-(adenine-N6)-methyltransferase n=1 Tax=Limnobaculum xujianqingii TaxID=2738837 RepID=UPI00112BAB39|nr:Dam family site-specific DNA-(adenine-N6)-methyltransferase [Limnobaculum xujianqingii]
MTNRSILKWAGGKGSIINDVKKHLPPGKRLIEPFVGAGNVFINTDYDEYILNDINYDLINVYEQLYKQPDKFIVCLLEEFSGGNNADVFGYARNSFNSLDNTTDGNRFMRAVLFVYLNRHCFNGLCRYNQKGQFNVPFGKFKSVYFPQAELEMFATKLKKATLFNLDFEEIINMAGYGDVVYCDPPYIPASSTSDFTQYYTAGFTNHDQKRLRNALLRAVGRRASIVVSNSDTSLAQFLYHCFVVKRIKTHRSIGAASGSRKRVTELIAIKYPEISLKGLEPAAMWIEESL